MAETMIPMPGMEVEISVHGMQASRFEAIEAAEAARSTAETERESAESARAGAEQARVNAESVRNAAESGRKAAEEEREQNEAARAEADGGRATAESARVEAENLRASAETGRAASEAARAAAESARASAEQVRADAEAGREAAEAARASAETARAEAESGRAAAEALRAETFAGYESRFDTKLDNTPDAWPAWTADEQAKARERMSVENGSDFELLVDAVLEEEANTFLVQFPKPVRECMYHIWFYNNNGENVTAVTRCLDVGSTGYYLLKYTSNIRDACGYVLNGYFRYNGPVSAKSVVGYASESTVSSWTSDVPGNGNAAYMNYPIETAMKKADGIQFYLNSPSHVLNAGAVIKVWGR